MSPSVPGHNNSCQDLRPENLETTVTPRVHSECCASQGTKNPWHSTANTLSQTFTLHHATATKGSAAKDSLVCDCGATRARPRMAKFGTRMGALAAHTCEILRGQVMDWSSQEQPTESKCEHCSRFTDDCEYGILLSAHRPGGSKPLSPAIDANLAPQRTHASPQLWANLGIGVQL